VLLAFLVLSATGPTESRAQGVHFHAVLVGGNEVAAGDPDGFGTAAIHFRSATEVCVAVIVNRSGVPTAAHIHKAFPPQNGPVVVPLTTPNGGNPGSSVSCVAVATSFYAEMRANPSQFYVNVHTTAFPGGAIRGQIF
jgi:hypothetical protein